ERVLAVNINDGTIRWTFTPPRLLQDDPACDWDFGATANLGTDSRGAPTFLGVAGKDGTYYSLDPATGTLRWQHNVVFGGFAGGMTFVGTGISKQIQIRDAGSGLLLSTLALPAGSDSGVAVAGNALFFGIGTSEQFTPAGVFAYTPFGVPPVLRTPP